MMISHFQPAKPTSSGYCPNQMVHLLRIALNIELANSGDCRLFCTVLRSRLFLNGCLPASYSSSRIEGVGCEQAWLNGLCILRKNRLADLLALFVQSCSQIQ